jgi:hypothetical protein
MMYALRLIALMLLNLGMLSAATVDTVAFVSSNGTYGVGDAVIIRVTFSGNVNVNQTTSQLRLKLNRLANDAYATATADATTVTTADFRYIVRTGDFSTDLDYSDTGALTGVTGLTLGLPAVGTLSGSAAVRVDTPLVVQNVTSSPASGTLALNSNTTITVALNRFATATAFTPSLKMASDLTGGIDAPGSAVSAGPVSSLSFTYTVGTGHASNDLDYPSSSALTLNGTLDGLSSLALPTPGAAGSLGANSSLVVDGIAPTLTITTPTSDQKTAPITYTLTASESVTGLSSVSLIPKLCTATLTGSGTAYTASLTPISTIQLSTAATAGATTLAVNDITGLGLSVDCPVVIGGVVYTIASLPSKTSITLTTALAISQPSGTSIFPPTGVSVGIELNANAGYDAAGNGTKVVSKAPTIYDPTPPFPKITAPAATTAPTTLEFTIVFTETVATTLTNSGMTVTNGAITTIDGALNPTFKVTVTPTDNTLPVILTLLAGAVEDAATNNSLAATATATPTDSTAPILTITNPATAQKTSPITYSIAASETVLEFTATGLTKTNCTAILTGSGAAYTARLTPVSPIQLTAAAALNTTDLMVNLTTGLAAGDPIFIGNTAYIIATLPNSTSITLTSALSASQPNATSIFSSTGIDVGMGIAVDAAHDASGNKTAAVPSKTTKYDPTPPLPKITKPTVTAMPATILFTVTFNEAVVAPLNNSGMSVVNGTITTIDSTLSPIFKVTVTPTDRALPVTLNVLAAAVTDSATNSSLAATATFDVTPPTVTLSGPSATATNPAELVITFSEPVVQSSLDATDFVLPADVTLNTITWNTSTTATVSFTLPTSTTKADYPIKIKVGAVTDAAGNASTDTPSATISYDPLAPTLTLTSPTTPQAASPITIKIEASKPVTGLTPSDCNVSYGTASNLTDINGSGTKYTVKLTPVSTMTLARAAAVGVSTIRLQARATTPLANNTPENTIPANTVLLIGNSVVRLATTKEETIIEAGVEVALESPLSSALALDLPVWQATGTHPSISIPVNSCEDDNHTKNSKEATSVNMTYDPTPPMFRITAPTKLEANGSAIFTLTPSEQVNNLTPLGLTATNGTVTAVKEAADHKTWEATVTPSDATSVGLSVNANAAIDLAGNPSLAEPAASMTIKPYVTKVTCKNTNGTYGSGIHLQVVVTFNEAVTVVGTPSLLLNLTTTGKKAIYGSTASNELVFDYTTVNGDQTTDLDYLSTTSLALEGATIKDASSGAADLTLPAPAASGSLSANAAIVVNTSGPTGPGKPEPGDNPSAGAGGCGAGSGIALILVGGWLGLSFSRRRRAA